MDRLALEIRLAFRALLKRPLVTLAIVVTLALGLGANAAIFGVVDALVLRPFRCRT
jgi:putative ABC transport system permease protein